VFWDGKNRKSGGEEGFQSFNRLDVSYLVKSTELELSDRENSDFTALRRSVPVNLHANPGISVT
jgi:hypothetical protein